MRIAPPGRYIAQERSPRRGGTSRPCAHPDLAMHRVIWGLPRHASVRATHAARPVHCAKTITPQQRYRTSLHAPRPSCITINASEPRPVSCARITPPGRSIEQGRSPRRSGTSRPCTHPSPAVHHVIPPYGQRRWPRASPKARTTTTTTTENPQKPPRTSPKANRKPRETSRTATSLIGQ